MFFLVRLRSGGHFLQPGLLSPRVEMTLEISTGLFALSLLAALGLCWRVVPGSAGLPLAYLLSLGMNHAAGALVHLVPENQTAETPLVVRGFAVTTMGALAFLLGAVVLSFRPIVQPRAEPRPGPWDGIDPKVASRLVLAGVLIYAVGWPVLKRVPSLGAAAATGCYMVVVGLCLGARQACRHQQFPRLLAWLAAGLALPAVTVLSMGFLGYGAAALLALLAFTAVHHRPRWTVPLGGLLAVFLGLSLAVTYFRDRSLVRDAVWGGRAWSDRIQTVVQMLESFEFFSLTDPRHAAAVDSRLNQNILVGHAVEQLDAGVVEFAHGDTIRQAVIGLIPRILWPGKPMRAGSAGLVTRFTGIEFAEGTSVGIGQIMEFYVNFAAPGVWIGCFVIGLLVRWADIGAARALAAGDVGGFTQWYLPGLSCLNTGGSLFELLSTAAAATVMAWMLRRFVPRLFGPPPATDGGVDLGTAESH